MSEVKNIFKNLPDAISAEQFETLLQSDAMRLERIISRGQCTEKGHWYDQSQAEWVILLQGSAGLHFEDEEKTISLQVGDYVFIAPHRRHRVEWTCESSDTIWLAVHIT